ncbi:hypothetical protein B5F35_01205 [Anaeromassilibacillus sp. An200]|nr:hypothetical protein B5F35_01205 [Anaeromassilibacillus sp. An200]
MLYLEKNPWIGVDSFEKVSYHGTIEPSICSLRKGGKSMEKPVVVTRRVDELGRIVLPIELRKQAGIEKGEEFQISVRESSGEIILKKVKPVCLRCQSEEGLRELKPGCYLCERCIGELR